MGPPGYSAEGVSVKIRRKARNQWLTLKSNPPVGITVHPRMVTSCWPTNPMQALRPQAHAPVLRHEALYSALQLRPRPDG